MNRKLVVFDFDGTLVDFTHAFGEALIEFSVARNMPYDMKKMSAGYTHPDKYDLGWGVSIPEQKKLLDELSDFLKTETSERHRFMPPMFQGIQDMLAQLSNEYDLSIVTARHNESLMTILKHHKIAHHFPNMRTLTCANERGYPIKPAPDAVYCLLKDTKHALEDVVIVGDTIADIDMANAAGVKSIAVAWGMHPRERLMQSGPSVMAETVDDLPRVIKELFN